MPSQELQPTHSASTQTGWRLENSYADLPKLFYTAVEPTPVSAPRLVVANRSLAASLGLSAGLFESETAAAVFAGNRLPPDSKPIAQAYAGHQFGNFTALGDGRAILLGEQITPSGERFDIQLKGSGPTPYSRRGDGRAALGPMLREYIISEAMHALGIPTTRSLAVAVTGEEVWRQEGALPGAVLTRVASSHLRVGTFEWATAAGGESALRALTDYTLQRHYPEFAEAENPAFSLLEIVIERQAALIAQWMLVGFIHGVMNTDNVALSGETIDYGPCAFMDAYDPQTVFSSIDLHGRYAYVNQPVIAQWNLARFAEALLPLLHPEEKSAIAIASGAIESFENRFQRHWLDGMRRKLGLFTDETADLTLSETLLNWMHRTNADYTNTFAALDPKEIGQADPDYIEWHQNWQERLSHQTQSIEQSAELRRSSNPVIIPRNHLVEAALAAAQQGDLDVMTNLLEALADPYNNSTEFSPEYRLPAPSGGAAYQTFCGT